MNKWLLAASLLIGCASPVVERQDEAVDIVATVYNLYGLNDARPVKTIWYHEQDCIPAPWDPEHDERCRKGRSWAFGFFCQIEVVWRGERISNTSFAHELLHCASTAGETTWGDPGHLSKHWHTTLHIANRKLWEAGL